MFGLNKIQTRFDEVKRNVRFKTISSDRAKGYKLLIGVDKLGHTEFELYQDTGYFSDFLKLAAKHKILNRFRVFNSRRRAEYE